MPKNDKLSLGEFLQQTRKEKGVSIDEIVRETNIAKRYLEDLEEDRFENFPAETYILGFLSTYADALEIDKKIVSSMYRRQMKLEQEAPLEELVGIRKSHKFSPVIQIAGLLLISGIVLAIILTAPKKTKKNSNQTRSNSNVSTGQTLNFTTENIEDLSKTPLTADQKVLISNNTRQISLSVGQLTSSKSVDISVNSTIYNMKKGEILNLDTDNNHKDDMGLELISIKNKKVLLSVILITEQTNSATSSSSNTVDISKYQDVILLEKTIFTASSKQNTPIKIQFKGKGWLEYQSDQAKPAQIEMKSGQSLTLSMKDMLVLSLANAGAATLLIGDKIEKGGKFGEINKSLFYWKNTDGKFQLIRAFLK